MVIMHTCLLSRILATVMDITARWYSSFSCSVQPREGSPHNALHSPSIHVFYNLYLVRIAKLLSISPLVIQRSCAQLRVYGT